MKALLNSLRRFSLTGVVVLAALWAGYKLWHYYMDAPWTRDGHVRADVVPVAPDVSGFVTDVLVKDNQQVQRGDVLFRIDRARYEIALKQAEAVLLGKARHARAGRRELTRYNALTPASWSPSRRWTRSLPPRVRRRPPTTRPSRTLLSLSSTLSAVRCEPSSMVSSPTYGDCRGARIGSARRRRGRQPRTDRPTHLGSRARTNSHLRAAELLATQVYEDDCSIVGISERRHFWNPHSGRVAR